MSTRIGEVVEASTSQFVAESYELHSPPPLGSLIKTSAGEVDIYGVVFNASTESTDPGRRPVARGRDEATEDDIYRQNPQLSRLFRTTFDAVVIGHGQGNDIRHYLPPVPPRVHSFVHSCEVEEIRRFTASLYFLSTLLNIRDGSGDEIVAACLREASRAHDDPRAFLVGAGKELALLLSGQFNRLNTILRRIRL